MTETLTVNSEQNPTTELNTRSPSIPHPTLIDVDLQLLVNVFGVRIKSFNFFLFLNIIVFQTMKSITTTDVYVLVCASKPDTSDLHYVTRKFPHSPI